MKSIFAIIFCAMYLILMAQARRDGHVIFYQYPDFKGESTKYNYNGVCSSQVDDGLMSGRASSVNIFTSNECLRLYKNRDCKGDYVTIQNKAPRLSDFGFNDVVKSYSGC